MPRNTTNFFDAQWLTSNTNDIFNTLVASAGIRLPVEPSVEVDEYAGVSVWDLPDNLLYEAFNKLINNEVESGDLSDEYIDAHVIDIERENNHFNLHFEDLSSCSYALEVVQRAYNELYYNADTMDINFIDIAKHYLENEAGWPPAELVKYVFTIRNDDVYFAINSGTEHGLNKTHMKGYGFNYLTPDKLFTSKFAKVTNIEYKRVETNEPEKIFNNKDYKIESKDMYLLTEKIVNNYDTLFNKLKSDKAKSALCYLNSIVNHNDFDDAINKVYNVAQGDTEQFIINTLQSSFAPFCSTGKILNIRNYRSNNPTLNGMINTFLKNVVSKPITSIKFIACSKRSIIMRVTTINSIQFKYYQFNLMDGVTLTQAEWDSMPRIDGVKYLPDMPLYVESEYYTESSFQLESEGAYGLMFKSGDLGKSINPFVSNKAPCKDWLNVGIDVSKLPEQIKKNYNLASAKPYLINEERLAEKKEFPDVIIGAKNCEISFKSKRSINDMIAIILRSYPLVYGSGHNNLVISCNKLRDNGSFVNDEFELYRLHFTFFGRTLYVEACNDRDSIMFAFMFQDLDLELDKSQLDMLVDLVKEDYYKLKIDNLSSYSVINHTISNNVAKISRMLYAEKLAKADKIYVDESLRSFFDGIKSTLANKMAKPTLANGKLIDARIAPIMHACVLAKDTQLMTTIDKITKQNYYKGGVCVRIKR